MSNILDYNINLSDDLISANSDLRFAYNISFTDNLFDNKTSKLHFYGKEEKGSRRLIFIDDSLSAEVEKKILKLF